MPMTAKVKEYGLLVPGFLTLDCLIYCAFNGMRRFRSRYYTLAPCERHACFKDFYLVIRYCFYQFICVKLAHDRRVTVIPQTSCMNSGWHKIMPHCEHLKKRC